MKPEVFSFRRVSGDAMGAPGEFGADVLTELTEVSEILVLIIVRLQALTGFVLQVAQFGDAGLVVADILQKINHAGALDKAVVADTLNQRLAPQGRKGDARNFITRRPGHGDLPFTNKTDEADKAKESNKNTGHKRIKNDRHKN